MLVDELRRKSRQINDTCQHFGAQRIRVFDSIVKLTRAYDLFASAAVAATACLEHRSVD